MAKGVDLLANLEQALGQIDEEIGPPQLTLVCDCILRKLEIAQNGIDDEVAALLGRSNTIGFSTYGEQFRGVHINQTLVGVAIGEDAGDTR
jgi:hypothetical protein